jgi:hypothetical protein
MQIFVSACGRGKPGPAPYLRWDAKQAGFVAAQGISIAVIVQSLLNLGWLQYVLEELIELGLANVLDLFFRLGFR